MLHTYPLNEIMKARLFDLESMLRAVMEQEKRTGQQASIMYVKQHSHTKALSMQTAI